MVEEVSQIKLDLLLGRVETAITQVSQLVSLKSEAIVDHISLGTLEEKVSELSKNVKELHVLICESTPGELSILARLLAIDKTISDLKERCTKCKAEDRIAAIEKDLAAILKTFKPEDIKAAITDLSNRLLSLEKNKQDLETKFLEEDKIKKETRKNILLGVFLTILGGLVIWLGRILEVGVSGWIKGLLKG